MLRVLSSIFLVIALAASGVQAQAPTRLDAGSKYSITCGACGASFGTVHMGATNDVFDYVDNTTTTPAGWPDQDFSAAAAGTSKVYTNTINGSLWAFTFFTNGTWESKKGGVTQNTGTYALIPPPPE